jgi:AraC-like DNA-binding protein
MSSESLDQESSIDQEDVLSQVLMLIKLEGEKIWSDELSAPWSIRFEAGFAHFHLIVEGDVEVRIKGHAPTTACIGDLLLLPRGEGHEIADREGGALSLRDAHPNGQAQSGASLIPPGDRPMARLISGSFRFLGVAWPSLLGAMPGILRISKNEGGNAQWVEPLIHFALAEARLPSPGSRLMISRLIDLLVVRTLRSWAAGGGASGWLGGIGDRHIERVLAALHGDPWHDWTIRELADIAVMSRSAFAERFARRIGQPPLRYLKQWRLAVAAGLLREGTMKVGEVGRRVGYQSDAAFSRAFKAAFGYPPTTATPPRRPPS